jgi:hypothetical protein
VDHLALPTGSSKPTTFCSKSSKKIYNWPCWRCPRLAQSRHALVPLSIKNGKVVCIGQSSPFRET